jgi:hypothetical protein
LVILIIYIVRNKYNQRIRYETQQVETALDDRGKEVRSYTGIVTIEGNFLLVNSAGKTRFSFPNGARGKESA